MGLLELGWWDVAKARVKPTRAHVEAITAGPDAPLEHASDYSGAEIRHLVATECVCHLDDLILRRTSLAFEGRVTEPLLVELAEIVGSALGWNQDARDAEVASTLSTLRDRHGVDLKVSAATSI